MQYISFLDIFGPNALELKSKLEKLLWALKGPSQKQLRFIFEQIHRDLLYAQMVISPGVEKKYSRFSLLV